MRLSPLLLIGLFACYEKTVEEDDDGGSTTDDGGAFADGGSESSDGGTDSDGGGGDGGDGGDDTGWWKEDPGDADGDGYSVDDGDCDDGDRTVYPGADDSTCDGEDNDCDDDVDEDFDRDSYEPNDDDPYEIGVMKDESDAVMIAWLFPDDDDDRFLFYVEDGDWSWFDIELWLYDVPPDADYALELRQVEDADGDYIGLVDSADEESDGGEELINYGGSYGFDDTGWYEARVYSTDGSSCDDPYTLQILVGSWR